MISVYFLPRRLHFLTICGTGLHIYYSLLMIPWTTKFQPLLRRHFCLPWFRLHQQLPLIMTPKRRRTDTAVQQKPDPPGKDSHSSSSDVQFDPYPLAHVYRLIEPGPVLLVTTGSLQEATHNVMTIGFHMMMQHESPPLIGITLGPWNASFTQLRKHRACVLAVPSVEMASTVVDIGNCSAADGEGPSKWERFALEPRPADQIEAPLVAGPHIMANVECVVEDSAMVRKYGMWVLRPVKAWTKNGDGGQPGTMFHHRGQGVMVADGKVTDLSPRMVKWQEFLD